MQTKYWISGFTEP